LVRERERDRELVGEYDVEIGKQVMATLFAIQKN
jgi:hypothetical protein